MDIRQLRYFIAIAEECQITAAAKKSHMAEDRQTCRTYCNTVFGIAVIRILNHGKIEVGFCFSFLFGILYACPYSQIAPVRPNRSRRK